MPTVDELLGGPATTVDGLLGPVTRGDVTSADVLPRTGVSALSGGTVERIEPDTALGEDFATDFLRDFSRPAVELPKFKVNRDDTRLAAVTKTAANLLIALPEFVESPLGIATGGAAGIAPRLVAGAFLADTGKNVIQGAGEAGKHWDEMSPAERAAAATELGGQTALAALMAHGATRHTPTQAEVLAKLIDRAKPVFTEETLRTLNETAPAREARPGVTVEDLLSEERGTAAERAKPAAQVPEELSTPPSPAPAERGLQPASAPEVVATVKRPEGRAPESSSTPEVAPTPETAAAEPAAATPAAAANVLEIPLGVNRRDVIDPSLRQLSEKEFDAEFASAKQQVNAAEKSLDDVADLSELTQDQRQQIAEAQDRWSAADLERLRRNYSDIHTEDVFRKMIDLADVGTSFEKFKVLADIIRERGGAKAEDVTGVYRMLPERLRGSADFREALGGKLGRFKDWLLRAYTESPPARQELPAAQESRAPAQPVGQRVSGFGSPGPRVPPSPPPAPRPPPSRVPLPPTPAGGTPAPLPSVGPIRNWLAQRTLGFKRVFAPQTIDSGAAQVGNIMRELLGVRANDLAQAEAAMHELRTEFDRTPVPKDWRYPAGAAGTAPGAGALPYNYAVIDALERNRAALPPRYQAFAKYFDDAFAWRIKAIQKFAPNALQHLITDYFPHVWEDPQRAAGVMQQVANRLFAGRKEFLKARSLPFFAEGLERGLKPISDNPVDLLLAKLHSMDKFLAALKAQAEFKAIGKFKFKYFFEAMPEGWQRIDDPAFIVQKPPVVTVKEAFDDFQRAKLGELLQHLGVSYQRVASLGGKAWAYAYEATKEIKARVGTSEDVLWHEAGHHLDYQFPDLRTAFALKGKSTEAQELRALVDLNHPGEAHNPKSSYHKYLRKSEEKMAEVVRAYVHAPDLFRSTAPTVWSAFNGWLNKHADIRQRLDAIRPGMKLGAETTDIKLGGMQVLGHWIMPDGPAAVLKNYLSSGLAQSGVYRSVRAASNLLNAAQLGLSAFHLGFTSLDAAVNAVEVGLFQALHGELLRGVGTLAKAPLAPVANYYTGKAIQAAMLNPAARSIKAFGFDVPISHEAHNFADLAVKAGLRATVDPFWQTHMTRNLMRSIRQGGLQWAKTPLQAPLALVEQTMRPITEYLVPRQKLGVFSLLAKSELDRLPATADAHTVRAALARAANATEDRMGQMTYENLFYNRMAKDLALLAFRAYGWQLGKYRHLAGAVADTATSARQLAAGKLPDLTHRQLYFVALPVVVGAIGGVLHKLFTGQNPQSLVDYLHPSTGQQDDNGNAKRLSLPSYLKDLESDFLAVKRGAQAGGPMGVGQGLWTATYHRANPWIAQVVDTLNNRDFYGTQIWNEDDPLYRKMLDQAAFFGKGAIPFSITGVQRLQEGEHSARDYLLPFIGIVPAKQSLTMTPAQAKAAEIAHNQSSLGGRTAAQAVHSQALKAAVQAMRANQPVPAEAAASLAPMDYRTAARRAGQTPFEYQVAQMPLENAKQVWDLASPAEKQQLVPVMVKKIVNEAKRGHVVDSQFIQQVAGWGTATAVQATNAPAASLERAMGR